MWPTWEGFSLSLPCQVLAEADLNRSGTINEQEFRHIMSKSPDFAYNFRFRIWCAKMKSGLFNKTFIGWTRLDILTALKVSLYLFEWLNHAPCSLSLSSWTRSGCSFFFSGLWHPHSRNTFKYSVLRSLHCSMACCMSQSCKTLAHCFSSFLSQIFINGTCDRTWSLWRQHIIIASSGTPFLPYTFVCPLGIINQYVTSR